MNKKILIILIILDLFWAIAALSYDWSAIFAIPVYFWPFIIICPIYPLLLALAWLQFLKKNHANSYLIAFATIPSLAYFIGAVIYYPAFMALSGINIWFLGGILWVTFYGLQAVYLSIKKPIAKIPLIAALSFLLVSFVVQYSTKSYGYLDYSAFGTRTVLFIYITVFATVISYLFIVNNYSENSSKKRNYQA